METRMETTFTSQDLTTDDLTARGITSCGIKVKVKHSPPESVDGRDKWCQTCATTSRKTNSSGAAILKKLFAVSISLHYENMPIQMY